MIPQEDLLSKPIKLRNSLIFYLGHIPTFAGECSVQTQIDNCLFVLDIHLTRALSTKPTDPKAYQLIFERGIDPDVDDPEQCHSHSEIPDEWPSRSDILDYQDRVRHRIQFSLEKPDLERNRVLGEALWLGFEHEAMHLETFLYMLIQSERILPPPGIPRPDFEKMFLDARENKKTNEWFAIPEQTLSVGLDCPENKMPEVSFGWDNEIPSRTVTVQAFEAQGRAITNGEYARYLQANRLRDVPASWVKLDHTNGVSNGSTGDDLLASLAVRTVFGSVPLKLAQDWPVIASYEELEQYASWMNCRLPTFEEAKGIYAHSARLKETLLDGATRPTTGKVTNGHTNGYHKNGYVKASTQPVLAPTASSSPVFTDLTKCNVGFKHWHPTPVIQDGDKLAGHAEFGGVWEWTSSPLTKHDGFKAMEIYPGYTC